MRPSHPQALGLDLFPTPPISRPETPFSSISLISGTPESPYEFPSPRLVHHTLPSTHSPNDDDVSPNPTMLSDVDHADFLSTVSQSQMVSWTISKANFMSAIGDGEDDDEFDVLP